MTTSSPFMLPDNRFDSKNAALYLGMSKKTMAQWRSQGKGPEYIKPTGGRIFYYKDELDAWLNRYGCFSSTSEAQFHANSAGRVQDDELEIFTKLL